MSRENKYDKQLGGTELSCFTIKDALSKQIELVNILIVCVILWHVHYR